MIPTIEQFAKAISLAAPTPIETAMLQWHYKAPGRVLTAVRLSELMGWEGLAANGPYGRFAARVASRLSWEPNELDRYWPDMKVSCLVLGERTVTDYEWTLRPEVTAAMEELGIAPLQADVTTDRISSADANGDASALSADGRRVWIKSFWGFGTDNESYLGFSREGDRKRFMELHRPGDLVLIYGAVAEETAMNDRRQALGVLEVEPIPVSDRDRSSPQALQEKIARGWADRWVYAVPVRRAWEIKRKIEIKHVAPVTYKYERARAIATQGELLTEAEATFALSLPVAEINVFLEPPITSVGNVDSLGRLLAPSRGIPPSFGQRTTTTTDGEHFLYLMHMTGDVGSVLGRDRHTVFRKSLVKVGYSNDPKRRLDELNSALPPNGAIKWKLAVSSGAFASADLAFAAETEAKADLAKAGESLGGEFFLGPDEQIMAAFNNAAGKASFIMTAPSARSRRS